MKIKAKIAVVLAVVIAAAVAARMGVFSDKASDQQLIETALTDSLKAAKEGRSGVVLDFVSKQFTAHTDFPLDRSQIAKYIRENHPDVTVVNTKATISGDSAVIVTPVDVKVEFMAGAKFQHQFKDVKLTFEREDSLQWLIIPGKKWRLTEVVAEGLPELESWSQ